MFLTSLVLIGTFSLLCGWAVHESQEIKRNYRKDESDPDWCWPRRQFFTNGRGR